MADIYKTRKCAKCGEQVRLSKFPETKTGYRCDCKDCYNKRAKFLRLQKKKRDQL
jgi:hypothetical protein